MTALAALPADEPRVLLVGRVVTRLPAEERTALWLVRQVVHEGLHHLRDVERVGALVS